MEEKQKCGYIGEERGTCVKEKKQEGKKRKRQRKKREIKMILESEMYG